MSKIAAERRLKIRELLLKNGTISTMDLAEMFKVSSESIRKDLIHLEKQGFAKKHYGGAQYCSELQEKPYELRNAENIDKKEAIARKAAEMIPPKSVILLDAGSTTFLLAQQLLERDDLTIFTNSMSVCNLLLSSNNNVFVIGGSVKSTTMSMVGMLAINAIESVHINIAFLGTSGFSGFNGPSAESFSEAELKQKIVSRSSCSIVLSDIDKCTSSALTQYAPWSNVDFLITNKPSSQDAEFVLNKISKFTKIIST